jgi:hypothetical protein
MSRLFGGLLAAAKVGHSETGALRKDTGSLHR